MKTNATIVDEIYALKRENYFSDLDYLEAIYLALIQSDDITIHLNDKFGEGHDTGFDEGYDTGYKQAVEDAVNAIDGLVY